MKSIAVSSRLFLTVAVLWLALAAPARAGFIITGSTTTIPAGGVGIVDFYITSDCATGNQLSSFQIQLQASQTFSPTNDGLNLQFTANQPTVYDQATYVFAVSSFFMDTNTPFWGNPFSTVTANDTIVGGDSNDSAQGYTTIAFGTPYLLAQVQVDPSQALDVFSINLTPSSGSFNTGTTYFDDPNGDGIGFTSIPGTVETEGPQGSATPEPSSLLLAGIGMLSGLVYTWRSRKQSRPRQCEAA